MAVPKVSNFGCKIGYNAPKVSRMKIRFTKPTQMSIQLKFKHGILHFFYFKYHPIVLIWSKLRDVIAITTDKSQKTRQKKHYRRVWVNVIILIRFYERKDDSFSITVAFEMLYRLNHIHSIPSAFWRKSCKGKKMQHQTSLYCDKILWIDITSRLTLNHWFIYRNLPHFTFQLLFLWQLLFNSRLWLHQHWSFGHLLV